MTAFASPTIAPPRAERRPAERSAHGVKWVDDYAWLRAANWEDVLRDPAALAPDIRTLIDAENVYCDAALAPTKAMQAALVAEMRALM